MILNDKEILDYGPDGLTALAVQHLRKAMLDHNLEITHEEVSTSADTSMRYIHWQTGEWRLNMCVMHRGQEYCEFPSIYRYEIRPILGPWSKVPGIQHHPLFSFHRTLGRFYTSGNSRLEMTPEGELVAKRSQIKELYGYLKTQGKTLSINNAPDGSALITWEGRKPFDMILMGNTDVYTKIYDDHVQEMILRGFIPTHDPLVFL